MAIRYDLVISWEISISHWKRKKDPIKIRFSISRGCTLQRLRQRYYFFPDGNEKRLAGEGYGYDPGISKFIALLDRVKEEYKKKNHDTGR